MTHKRDLCMTPGPGCDIPTVLDFWHNVLNGNDLTFGNPYPYFQNLTFGNRGQKKSPPSDLDG